MIDPVILFELGVGITVPLGTLYIVKVTSRKQKEFERNYESYLEKLLGSKKSKQEREYFLAEEIINRVIKRRFPSYPAVAAHVIGKIREQYARRGEKLDTDTPLGKMMSLQLSHNLL